MSADADRSALQKGFDGFETGTVLSRGTRIGYRVAGQGPAVLLIHGFPESGLEYEYVAPLLAERYRVIVPDYRGAAGSDVPADGYDKSTMAADLRTVVEALGEAAVHVVGHDIGTTIAYAFARQHSEDVTSLSLIEGVVPGTAMLDTIVASGTAWHFAFHQQVDLATSLIEGREDRYVDYFFDNFLLDARKVDAAQRRFYAAALARPGAVRAAMSTYAAWFGADAADNRAYIDEHGLLSTPTLALGGMQSMGPFMPAIASDVARDVTAASVNAAHFVMEEAPEEVAQLLLEHFDKHS